MPAQPSTPSLTQRRIEALKPDATRYEVKDDVIRGLRLRVSPTRKGGVRRVWTLKYRYLGSERRYLIGDYSNKLGVAEARERARALLGRVAMGVDPGEERDRARRAAQAQKEDRTFAKLVLEYLKDVERRGLRSAYVIRRGLERNVLPAWRAREVGTITAQDVQALITRLAERAPIQANRVLSYVQGAFQYARVLGWRTDNPAHGVNKPTKEVPSDRELDANELRLILGALRGDLRMPVDGEGGEAPLVAPFDAVMRDCLLVAFYTGQRGGEVAGMRWSDVDLEANLWTLPGRFTKNKQPHTVPLSQSVRTIIDRQPRSALYVFSRRPGRHIGARVKRAASELSAAIDAYLIAQAKEQGQKLPKDRVPFAFKLHDARRTAATRMAKAGIGPHVLAHVLNHISETGRSVTARHYNMYAYDAEKRRALEVLASGLDALITDKTSGRLLSFAR